MPASVLFSKIITAEEIIPVLDNPTAYQSNILKKIKKQLEPLAFPSLSDLPDLFLEMILPPGYTALSINATELSKFLILKLGKNPNMWMIDAKKLQDVILKFIHERYAQTCKSQAINKVSAMSEKTAKDILLKFVENNPDVGLKILEK